VIEGHPDFASVDSGDAFLATMRADGCRKVAIANDRDVYGGGMAFMMRLQAARFGVRIISNTGLRHAAHSYRPYARRIKRQGADCFAYSGVTTNGAVRIIRDVGAALPRAVVARRRVSVRLR
jgi:branched-chain amino acid transport system substrate-binding protein